MRGIGPEANAHILEQEKWEKKLDSISITLNLILAELKLMNRQK